MAKVPTQFGPLSTFVSLKDHFSAIIIRLKVICLTVCLDSIPNEAEMNRENRHRE